MVKTTSKEENDGSTDSGDEQNRNDDNSKISSKCIHITKAIDFAKVKKYIKQSGFSSTCSECERQKNETPELANNDDEEEEGEYDRSLWMCLRCGLQFCGRTVNKHAIAHYEVTKENYDYFLLSANVYEYFCCFRKHTVTYTQLQLIRLPL